MIIYHHMCSCHLRADVLINQISRLYVICEYVVLCVEKEVSKSRQLANFSDLCSYCLLVCLQGPTKTMLYVLERHAKFLLISILFLEVIAVCLVSDAPYYHAF